MIPVAWVAGWATVATAATTAAALELLFLDPLYLLFYLQ